MYVIVNSSNMKNVMKIEFVDKVVDTLSRFCPSLGDEVMFFIACQFALESNFGQSRLAVTKNNFCGMMVPSVRPSTNIGSLCNFAEYRSFEDCVLDYIYWLCYNKFFYNQLLDVNLFSRKLIASNYCPDKDYIDRIFNLFNNLKSLQNV